MGQIRQWNFYVDESGDFDSGDGDPAVAGLLVAEDCQSVSRVRLKDALQRAMPAVGWPIHATYTRIPVMHALWEAIHCRRERGPTAELQGDGGAAAEDIFRLLEKRLPQDFERVRIAVESGRDPDWESVQKLDRVLKRVNRGFHNWCCRRKRNARNGLKRVLEAMVAEAGQDSMWLVLSGEAAQGDTLLQARDGVSEDGSRSVAGAEIHGRNWAEAEAEAVGASTATANELRVVPASELSPDDELIALNDRYLILLSCCLRRVAHLLTALGGDHRIQIRACRRRVAHETLPAKLELRPQDVGRAAAHATGRKDRRWQANSGSVRFVPMGTPAYQGDLHPCLVVADYLANVSRSQTRRDISLASLRHQVEKTVAMSVSMDDGQRPSIAASGVAQQHVENALAASFSPSDAVPSDGALFEPEVRLWAREQAFAWAAHFAKN